jgi:hypothetical protein
MAAARQLESDQDEHCTECLNGNVSARIFQTLSVFEHHESSSCLMVARVTVLPHHCRSEGKELLVMYCKPNMGFEYRISVGLSLSTKKHKSEQNFTEF